MASKSYRRRTSPQLLVGELSGLKGQFKPNLVPEIKVRYNKGRQVLGNVKSSEEAVAFLRAQYQRGTIELQEYFNVIYLNRRNSILGYYQHTKGGLVGTVADPRIVFGIALKSLSSGIILSHNHPGGQPTPSRADINITTRFKQIGELHEIVVLDHLIVTKNDYFSFSDEGLL